MRYWKASGRHRGRKRRVGRSLASRQRNWGVGAFDGVVIDHPGEDQKAEGMWVCLVEEVGSREAVVVGVEIEKIAGRGRLRSRLLVEEVAIEGTGSDLDVEVEEAAKKALGRRCRMVGRALKIANVRDKEAEIAGLVVFAEVVALVAALVVLEDMVVLAVLPGFVDGSVVPAVLAYLQVDLVVPVVLHGFEDGLVPLVVLGALVALAAVAGPVV